MKIYCSAQWQVNFVGLLHVAKREHDGHAPMICLRHMA